MYNNKLFGPESKVSSRLNDTPSNSVDCAAFQSQNNMPTTKILFKYLSIDMISI